MITKVLKRAFSTAGRLYTWGPTTFGWGREINDDLYTPGQVDKFNDINRVATGPYHLIFSNTHNQVYSVGLGNNGRLGTGNTNDEEQPTFIQALNGVEIKQLCAGTRHNLVLTTGGDVYAWGYGGRTGGVFKYLQFLQAQSPLGLGNSGDVHTPTIIQSLRQKVSHVAAGCDLSLAVGQSGKVYGWGSGISQLNQQPSSVPTELDQINYFLDSHHAHVKKVNSVGKSAFFLLDDGRLYVVGRNNGGVFGTRKNAKTITDNRLFGLTKVADEQLHGEKITNFKLSSNSLIFITESGSVYYTGMQWKYRPERFPVQAGTVKSIFATQNSVGVIDNTGKIGFINDPTIQRYEKKGDVYVSRDQNLKNAAVIGGTYGLKYAIVPN